MSKRTGDFDILSSRDVRSGVEERWVSFQPYLLSKGYRLRPRYHPDWVPSWRNTDLRPAQCEDNVDSMPIRVLDAIRVQDDCQVILKMIIPSAGSREGEAELDLLRYFSTPPLKDDPSNHVVPCLDSFPIPNVESGHFVVMPLLGPYNENPPFHNLAEVHDCIEQLFEGLIFMHKQGVAHCDIASPNIMMDSRLLFGEPFHPVYQTLSTDIRRVLYPQYLRSQKNMRYYFIDLGYAQWFRDPNTKQLTTGIQAREPAPEQKLLKSYDPFLADIYQLGAVLRNDLIPRIEALGVLDTIAAEMTQTNPADRPTLEAARRSMNTMFVGLGGWRYRRPILPPEAGFAARSIYFVWGISSEIGYWIEKIWRFFFRRRMGDGQV